MQINREGEFFTLILVFRKTGKPKKFATDFTNFNQSELWNLARNCQIITYTVTWHFGETYHSLKSYHSPLRPPLISMKDKCIQLLRLRITVSTNVAHGNCIHKVIKHNIFKDIFWKINLKQRPREFYSPLN